MNTSKISFNNIYLYLVFLIIAVIYLLRFSTSTSPLFIENGNDSAVFLMLGKYFFAGYTPYADFFDHKGPILILIESCGYQFFPQNGRLGVFLIQIINIFLLQIVIYKTASLFLSKLYSFTTVIFSLLFLRFILEGGNLSEEYSLFFITISLYITLKYYRDKKQGLTLCSMFVLGICAAIVIWIRLNNTATICACLLFITIEQIMQKKGKLLIKQLFCFLLGLLIVSVPIITYFWHKGAIVDLFYANFIFNFNYLGANEDQTISAFNSITSFVEYIFKSCLPFIILTLGVLLEYRKTKDYSIILLGIFLLFFSWIATQMGNLYYHYMMLNTSCYYLGIIFILKWASFKKEWNKILPIVTAGSLLLLLVLIIYGFSKRLNKSDNNRAEIEKILEIESYIPKEDYSSVYTYLVRPFYLPDLHLLPCYKYFIQQEWHSHADPQIKEQINEQIKTNPPLWIISQSRDSSSNNQFWQIVDNNYIRYFRNDTFELYKLNR